MNSRSETVIESINKKPYKKVAVVLRCNMKKSFFLLFCAVLFIAGCSKIEPEPPPAIAEGITGEITWKMFENGTLSISEKSTMPDYTYFFTAPWVEFNNDITKVIIGNHVSNIGNLAFSQHVKLTSVTIGSSVTDIGSAAFSDCTGLTEITNQRTIPQTIDNYVFYGINKQTCTLFVPAGSEATYRAADEWKDFDNIVAIQ